MIYLNIGCGNKRIKGNVINVDMNKDTRWYENKNKNIEKMDIDVQADARSLPFKSNTFDGVIANHILEHLSREHHQFAIAEWRRVLKFDKIIMIEVPDLERICKFFVENYLGLEDDYWYHCIYGRGAFLGDRHLSGLTKRSLSDLLLENGFYKLDWKFQEWGERRWENRPYMTVIAKKTELLPHRMGYSSTIDISGSISKKG